ncbi:unnamed protein product, partial [Ectocarpus sp. 13 AM-2016]
KKVGLRGRKSSRATTAFHRLHDDRRTAVCLLSEAPRTSLTPGP